MIAETLAGIALVKSAVDGIKGAIGTANDIGDIASQIDSLFAGQKQVNEARNRKSGVSLVDQFGVENVARETIDAKIAAEKLQEVATMVDMRFGHGTWRGIVDERARRIKEAKAAIAAKRKADLLRQNEIMENIKMGTIVCVLIMIAAGLFITVVASVS